MWESWVRATLQVIQNEYNNNAQMSKIKHSVMEK